MADGSDIRDMPARPPAPIEVERRRHPRAPLKAGVRAAVTNATLGTVRGWVRDIGLGGLWVECDAVFPVSSRVVVDVLLRDGATAHRIHVRGWVAHTRGGMGIQFFDLPDESAAVITALVADPPHDDAP